MKWLVVPLLVVAIAASLPVSGSPQHGAKTFLVVTFDVEDYVTPASDGIDDIPKWLAEILSEEGATATFFVIGEKARSLEKRGRGDVIAAMAAHDVGSHTNFGSIHPTVTEQLEKAGWRAGVRLMAEQESAGIAELERLFGKKVSILARHGGSYGPQLVCALGGMKAGYQGSPVSLPGRNVVWFCNALNFSAQYAGFDDFYYRNDLFGPVLARLDAEWPTLVRSGGVLALFAGHPCKIRTEQFWDLNFYGGRNTPSKEWKTPDLRSEESMETAKENFRRLIRFLKGRDDIEMTTYTELMELFGHQKKSLAREDLCVIARECLEKKSLLTNEYYSPAEAFAGLARAILVYRRDGMLPSALDVVHPLGPSKMPVFRADVSRVSLEKICSLAKDANDHIERTGALPSSLSAAGSPIGTGSLFALFSAVVLDMNSGKPNLEYRVPAFEPYPATNEQEIIRRVESYKSWPVHRPDLDMSGIIETTRLQLWTVKPAVIIRDEK